MALSSPRSSALVCDLSADATLAARRMLVEDVRSLLSEWGDRKGQPTVVVIDSRTLQPTPESSARASYDGAKRRKGSKVHVRHYVLLDASEQSGSKQNMAFTAISAGRSSCLCRFSALVLSGGLLATTRGGTGLARRYLGRLAADTWTKAIFSISYRTALHGSQVAPLVRKEVCLPSPQF